MSPPDEKDDSCSLVIGTDRLEKWKIEVAKSGDLNCGLHKGGVKEGEILVGHFEPRRSTASPTKNMKIAFGVCTAIGLVIFGVAR